MDTTIISLLFLGLLVGAVVLLRACVKWLKSFKKKEPPFKYY